MSHRYVEREVLVKEGWQGYMLASSIYKDDSNERLLLRKGRILTLNNIHSLQNIGIKTMKILVETRNE